MHALLVSSSVAVSEVVVSAFVVMAGEETIAFRFE